MKDLDVSQSVISRDCVFISDVDSVQAYLRHLLMNELLVKLFIGEICASYVLSVENSDIAEKLFFRFLGVLLYDRLDNGPSHFLRTI